MSTKLSKNKSTSEFMKNNQIPEQINRIDNLPCELLVYIFEFLDLIELISLRLTCKKWSIIIKNEIKLIELNIIDPFYASIKTNWFLRYHAYDHKYTVYKYANLSFDNYLKSNLFKSLFNQLKYLNLIINEYFNFGILNKFKYLTHLEVSMLNINYSEVIKLPNHLQTLSIIVSNIEKQLEIDAINLQNLNCNNLNKIKFKNFKSIKYLIIDSFDDESELNVNKYFNLEILYCKLIDNIDLNLLSNLKELNLFYKQRRNSTIDLNSICNSLLNKKLELNRSNLMITINGIELIDEEQLNKIDFSKEDLILQLDYLCNLKLPWLKVINLNKYNCENLINRFKINFNDVSAVLNKIETIKFHELIKFNENNLINFLSKSINLRKLRLIQSKINQTFFIKLSNVCPFLNSLSIESNRNQIIFDQFLTKFKYLNELLTDHNLNSKLLINLININQHLHLIEFRKGKRKVTIQKLNGIDLHMKTYEIEDDTICRKRRFSITELKSNL